MSDEITCSIKRIIKRNGTVVLYNRERITNAIYKATASTGQPDHDLAERMACEVETALIHTYGENAQPTVEDIQDIVEATLMTHQLVRIARNYIIYRHDRAMARAARDWGFEVTDNIPYKKIYEILVWNSDHECLSVQDLNRTLAKGGLNDLIHASEQRYAAELKATAQRIAGARDQVHLIIVAGPSSSAKTTTTLRLREELEALGLRLHSMMLDHYFFNLSDHPRDEFGDYDYERPQALNIDLINTHIVELLEGRPIKTPHYDFKTGLSTPEVHPFHLSPGEILLIDSLHGLYGPMTDRIPDPVKFKVYVETLGQFRGADGNFMRWSDHRLLRRMSRDKDHRNLQPMETLTHWHYVRRSELQDIIPYIATANAVINTALPYELPLLKHRLFHYFPEAIKQLMDKPQRQDAFVRAQRVFDLLSPLDAYPDDHAIPDNSLFREFIGGSRYHY